MPRHPMVTRTIHSTKVTCMWVNINTQETGTDTYILSGTITTEKKALEKAQEEYNTDEIKLVHIEKLELIAGLYGMDEAQFLKEATLLPPRQPKESYESLPFN